VSDEATETGKLLEALGIGLSRLLRYSYGGFLLIALASVVDPLDASKVLSAMPWELAALSAVVIGAGIYAVHRSVAIPLHHVGLCFILWVRDKIRRIKPEDSNSPTRWLAAIGVKKGQRITAYTALRRGHFFEEREKRELDVAHAESGLVVMTFEGFAIAALYAWCRPDRSQIGSSVLFVLFVIFLLASYPAGYVQHQVECIRLRKREADVKAKLSELGILESCPTGSAP
jgi:hypothetical protein